MLGYKARTLLVKAAPVNWLALAVLAAWRTLAGLPDKASSLIVLVAALAICGTLIASVRWVTITQPADALLTSLLASRERELAARAERGGRPVLRVARSDAESGTPAQEPSAG